MTKKIKLIFNALQEYIESEYMVFKTLESDMLGVTIATKER